MNFFLKNLNEIKNLLPIYAVYNISNQLSLLISSVEIQFVLYFLKQHFNYQYKLLTCISGVDFLGKAYRYCVVYELLSLCFNSRIRIKALLSNSAPIIFSIVSIFECANWWEREIWDLFGIFFEGHPDLRRILTDYGFEGHPLKKDFPLSGFIEVRYNETKKKVVVEPVVLAQEYRNFTFEMPW